MSIEEMERALDCLIPRVRYQVYIGGERPTIVILEEGKPSPYAEQHLVGKAFFERDLAELALFGYHLLQGDWLSSEECLDLARRLM